MCSARPGVSSGGGRCQVSFNMKERVYSAYTERKNIAKKRREEERRKKEEEE